MATLNILCALFLISQHLDAEAKLGEMLAGIPLSERRASSAKGTCTLPPGITKKESHYAQTIAKHPELGSKEGRGRYIENLECSEEFRQSNFRLSSYLSKQGKSLPMYLMTEEGFYFLAMGFTGACFKPLSAMASPT